MTNPDTIQPLEIDYRPPADLIPYINNAKIHESEQVDQIAASIKEFGFNNPILLDGDNGVIAGHGRLQAAQKLKLEQVPVIELGHLTGPQKKAYILADNRLAEVNTSWDFDLVSAELDALKLDDFDIELTGFDDGFLIDEPEEGLTDEDAVPDLPDEPATVLGDIWLMGDHKLMCGDSTSIDSVDQLIAGKQVDMVFTDPPYNIDYQGVSDKREKIKNDKMSDEDFVDFLYRSIMGCETMYVCCSWQFAHLFKKAMTDLSRSPKAMIVWNKVNPAQHLDKYFKQHEIIFYYGDFGGHKTLRGDVWEMKRQKNTVHPTMKPVELIDMAMVDQPDKKVVYDSFGGSGSTLISCEKNHKTCRMMELDEKYCDVIVTRWQEYTGRKATLEGDGRTFDEIKAERVLTAVEVK